MERKAEALTYTSQEGCNVDCLGMRDKISNSCLGSRRPQSQVKTKVQTEVTLSWGLTGKGTQDQPMEESYEEVTIKVVEQEWTCLGSQQLPCWTVMEDMPRM